MLRNWRPSARTSAASIPYACAPAATSRHRRPPTRWSCWSSHASPESPEKRRRRRRRAEAPCAHGSAAGGRSQPSYSKRIPSRPKPTSPGSPLTFEKPTLPRRPCATPQPGRRRAAREASPTRGEPSSSSLSHRPNLSLSAPCASTSAFSSTSRSSLTIASWAANASLFSPSDAPASGVPSTAGAPPRARTRCRSPPALSSSGRPPRPAWRTTRARRIAAPCVGGLPVPTQTARRES